MQPKEAGHVTYDHPTYHLSRMNMIVITVSGRHKMTRGFRNYALFDHSSLEDM